MTSLRRTIATRLVPIAAVIGILVLSQPAAAATDKQSQTYELLDLLGEVFERVRRDYVEDVSDEELIEAAVQGMLSSLDPHSVYLPPRNYQQMQVQTRGEFGGLGIEVTMEGGYVKVVAPIDDAPAFRAGLQSGDFITHLDGTSVQGMTLNQAVENMRGPVGTDLTLTIAREGRESFDVTITRDKIRITSVRNRVEQDVGYIRITTFSEQTEEGVKKAVNKIQDELGDSVKGYVIDLRNNPGGLLGQAVAVSDAFLEQGEIVSTQGKETESGQRFQATAGDLTDGLPLVILINGGSASASEIVAGALQDHGRAIVLGTRSFGKGSVQTIMPLSRNGAAIKLTTQRYYTPSGRSIQQRGIDPDIVVERARVELLDESRRETHEEDLVGSLQNEEKKPGAEDDEETAEAEAAEEQDYQLSRAIDLIRGISLYRSRAVNEG